LSKKYLLGFDEVVSFEVCPGHRWLLFVENYLEAFFEGLEV